MMTSKDFVALADAIRPLGVNEWQGKNWPLIEALCGFCKQQNPRFDRERFIGYLRGECGPRGGKVK